MAFFWSRAPAFGCLQSQNKDGIGRDLGSLEIHTEDGLSINQVKGQQEQFQAKGIIAVPRP